MMWSSSYIQPFKSKPNLYLAKQCEFALHNMDIISSTVLNLFLLTQNIFDLLKEGLKIHDKIAVLVGPTQRYC